MENKTITITEKQFLDAISEACDDFETAMDKVCDEPSPIRLAMNLQNMMLGMKIKQLLFDKTETENKGEE